MGARLMAIVAEGERGRIYLAPDRSMRRSRARRSRSGSRTSRSAIGRRRTFWTSNYGMTHFGDLFTPRQLVALTTFSDLVQEARELAKRDALAAGLPDDGKPLADGGIGATAYAEAVSVYCGLSVDKSADYNSSLVVWSPTRDQAKSTFARQALPMVWDFAEVNPFAGAAGDIGVSLGGISQGD